MTRFARAPIPSRSPTRARQRGQTMVEYIVAALAVIVLLSVVPIPGLGAPAGKSVVAWLIDVLHTWWMNFTFLISLP
ncbi:MAG: hypothetical protein JSR34_00290 [Proteobacteria bacterium]|nr:hypothetical protein [Pseudomonadota bacterium]